MLRLITRTRSSCMKELKLTRGEWRVDDTKVLGKPGGFGTVHPGESAQGAKVAIKIINPDVGDAAHREIDLPRHSLVARHSTSSQF